MGYFIILKNKLWDFTNSSKMIQYNKNNHELFYTFKNYEYSLLIKTRFKKPNMLERVLDVDNKDITELFRKRLGPSNDFHGISYTPYDFNTNKLTVEFLVGNPYIFQGNDIICI